MAEYDEFALDELTHRYIDGDVEFDEIIKFCDALEPTARNKKMLTECIDCFDIDVFYETLFDKFKEFLSPEESAGYKRRFKRAFGRELYSDDYLD